MAQEDKLRVSLVPKTNIVTSHGSAIVLPGRAAAMI